MRCRFCHSEMLYIHGHAACIRSGCPMYGVNQADCCDGETADNCPVTTSEIAALPDTISPKDDSAAPGRARAPSSSRPGPGRA